MNTPLDISDAPPSTRELFNIAVGLTVVCLIAAVILGAVYFLTEPAKAHNLLQREQSLIRQLLGLQGDARIEEVRRYLLWRGSEIEVMYLAPSRLLRFNGRGEAVDVRDVPGAVAQSGAENEKDQWVKTASTTPDDDSFRYAGRFFVGFQGEAIAGYVIEGVTPGFKTWIRFFLAIDRDYGLRGVEVIEHEEDPGLGAEITKRYFKNQFAGRSYAAIEQIEVIKDPLPVEWRKTLEELGEEMEFAPWLAENRALLERHPNIHAITGSTISSVAVTNGVKRALSNFRKRMSVVEGYL